MPILSAAERAAILQSIPEEDRRDAYAAVQHLLPGWNPLEDRDPLIDAPMFALLAGVAPNTPGAWQQRTREGTEKEPFPEPGEAKYHDKPQWFLISQALRYLIDSNRWPRGISARESTRADAEGRKRITFAELAKVDKELAVQLAALNANDSTARTLQGWRSLRTRRASRVAA